MSAHSPGPWRTNDYGLVTANDGRNTIAFVRGSDGDEVVQANARLIAAAPDLLAALESILDTAADREDIEDSEGGPRPNAWMQIAQTCRDAIAKVQP